MKNQLSKNDKEFFLRKKKSSSRVKIAVIAIVVFLLLGFMIDAFSGFYTLKKARSLGFAIGGLIILSLFYVFGEVGSNWINSKDDVSHPLHKRVFHLFVLICFLGVVMAVCWYVFKRLGW